MKNTNIPSIAKKKVFDSCFDSLILPCLTYGYQTIHHGYQKL